jgi:hypothetical protein
LICQHTARKACPYNQKTVSHIYCVVIEKTNVKENQRLRRWYKFIYNYTNKAIKLLLQT